MSIHHLMTYKTKKTRLVLGIAIAIILSGIIITSSTFCTAQASDQSASTNNAVTGNGLSCNTSSPRSGPFLTIDGVTGPDGKQCVFEIKDFSFGVENPTTIGSATGGAGAGKIKFNEFTIKKTSDSASPLFFLNAATGAHYDKVTIQMRKAGGDPQSAGKPFLIFKFGTVFTTKINWSGAGDEGPEESITFVYGTLQVQYQPQKPDSTSTIGCFDAIRNALC